MTHIAGSDVALDSSAIRFVTPYEEGDDCDEGPVRIAVSRVEGLRACRQCRRLHPYQVGRLLPDDEVPAADELFDSWQDAAVTVNQWLPDARRFLGHREPAREEDATERHFDNRAAAIEWLLESAP